MKSQPDKSLKARHTAIYNDKGFPYLVVTFDDGSVWRLKGDIWLGIWNPEPKPVEEHPLEPILAKISQQRSAGKMQVIPSGLAMRSADDIERIGALEVEKKAWKDAYNQVKQNEAEKSQREKIAVSHAKDLKQRLELAESQLKAWQDAASIDLAEEKGDPRIPCESPEELIERLRHLYRWASTAEKRATEAEAEVAEWVTIAKRIAPNHQAVRPSDIERKYNYARAIGMHVTPLDEARVMSTAKSIAYRKSGERTGFISSLWGAAARAIDCVLMATRKQDARHYDTE